MTSTRIKAVLASGLVSTVAYFAGKYSERNTYKIPNIQIVGQQAPIFASVLNSPSIDNAPLSLNKIKTLTKELLSLGSIYAASPITDPSSGNQLAKPSRISQIMKHGFPGLDNVISYNDYVLSYDRRNRVAHWVFEHMTAESVKSNADVDRSKCNFMEDNHIHPYFRSRNSDYKGSGYDRGHLAAAGNHKSCQQFVEDTFYLSNMAPQVGKGFNRDSWNRLEKYVRKLTKNYVNVYCCTGPLYLPRKESDGKMYVKYEVIGGNHVAVPTHFFKVVVGESKDGSLDMECYVMENTIIDDNISLKSFQVPLETVERAAGLLFFDNVSKNRILKINGKKS